MKTIKATIKHGDIDEAARKWDKLRRSPKFVTTQNYMYIWMLSTHQQLETADDGAAERLLQKWLPHIGDAEESKQIEQPHAGECASENKWLGVKIDTDDRNEIEQSTTPECDSERWIDVTVEKIRPVKTSPERATSLIVCPNYYEALSAHPTESIPPQDTTPEPTGDTSASACDSEGASKLPPTTRERRKLKRLKRIDRKVRKKNLSRQEEEFWDRAIERAEDERTGIAKGDKECPFRRQAEAGHQRASPPSSLRATTKEISFRTATIMRNLIKRASGKRGVRFDLKRNEHRDYRPADPACPDGQAAASEDAAPQDPMLPRRPLKSILADAVAVADLLDRPTALGDSGADGHYLTEQDRSDAELPVLGDSTKQVSVANGGVSKGNHVTELPIPTKSLKARLADTFSDFKHSLISIGKLADDGNVSVFSKDGLTVHREEDVLITCKGKPILIGVRDDRGRYRIPLVPQTRGRVAPRHPNRQARTKLYEANSVYDLPSTEEAVKWLHACLGYPVKSTWLSAIKNGHFKGWPVINERTVKKYYPETVETPKGHMAQTRKNVRSTKPTPMQRYKHADKLRGRRERDIFVKVYEARQTVYSDQTGKFPKRSQSGNVYIMVMVDIDSNCIFVEPMKSRKDDEMQRAYRKLMTRLKRAGVVPKKHVMDNEVSESMKDMIRDDYKLTLELVPPGMHRRNAAEVAIRNFKAHFLSILAGTADDFPLSLWDRLLPQAELTLNLLRKSNANPKLSAYAYLCGPFDYNKMPLAPLGCKVQAHEKADQRGSWAFHSVDGWYLGTSNEHYRTHICHVKDTRSDRLCDTVNFQHKSITNPTLSQADKLMHAISHCSKILQDQSTEDNDQAIRELEFLVEVTKTKLESGEFDPSPAARGAAPTDSSSTPYVEPVTVEPNQRVTRAMSNLLASQDAAKPSKPTDDHAPRVPQKTSAAADVPRVPAMPGPVQPTPQPVPRVKASAGRLLISALKPSKRRAPQGAVDPTGPAANTRSRNEPPAARTRAKKVAAEVANAVEVRAGKRSARQSTIIRRLSRRLEAIEAEVEEALAVLDHDSGKLLKYTSLLRHPKFKDTWGKAAADEFGRLAQGVGGRLKGTDTIKFIRKSAVPPDRMKDVTYGKFECKVRPEKADPNRVRLAVGGDRITSVIDVSTPTAEMLVSKILFNSVVSTKGAKFMTMDIKNFYLMTPLNRPEYLKLKLSQIPDEIIEEYQLRNKSTPDGSIYVEINKGMYGLPQAGVLANELLEKRLNRHGYYQSKLVPGLWKHETRPIVFALTVDDFGVKYLRKRDAEHLHKVLQKDYQVTVDWAGERYCGINLEWDYAKRQVHLSIPGYIEKTLLQFHHKAPTRRQDSPFPHTPPDYGAKKQYAKEADDAPALDKKGKRFIQQVCGKLLFYGRAVDSTLLTPISAIASQQAKPTETTMAQAKQLLDYVASQEEAVLTFSASEMKLAVHSDAGYLNEPNARSRAGGHFFLSNDADVPPNNGAILNISHVIKHVMSSATEAELAGLYIMAREAVYIRIILEEMGHKQSPTPVQTDNAIAEKVINKKVQPKRTKAMDMRFHWLRDRECQRQFRFYWRPGKLNYADYWTKHHPATHHNNVRRNYLTPLVALEMFRQEERRRKQDAKQPT